MHRAARASAGDGKNVREVVAVYFPCCYVVAG